MFGYVPPKDRTSDPFSDGRIVPITSKTVEGARRPSALAKAGTERDAIDTDAQERRKCRALEESKAKAERKAEKRKCDFCKRFSCIC